MAVACGQWEDELKKALVILGVLVILVVVAALAAPFFIPTDTLTAKLIAMVKQSTGRDLKIAGPVKLSLLPQLEVEASGVSFANAPGAHDADMMQLKKLEVQLRVLPLLHGGVELGRFVLDRAADLCSRSTRTARATGSSRRPPRAGAGAAPRWAAAPAPAPPPSAAASGGQVRTASLAELRLDDLRLSDGKISYRDDRTGKVDRGDQRDRHEAVAARSRQPLCQRWTRRHGTARRSSLSLGVASRARFLDGAQSGLSDPSGGATDQFRLRPATPPGLPPARPGRRGRSHRALAARSCQMGGHAAAARRRAPGTSRSRASIDMQGPNVVFSDAAIGLDAINAQGHAGGRYGGGRRPRSPASSQVDKLDLNPYLPPETTGGQGRPRAGGRGQFRAPRRAGRRHSASAAAQGWSDAPLDLSALNAADADLDLSTGGIDYRKIRDRSRRAPPAHLKDAKLARQPHSSSRSTRAAARARSRSMAAARRRRSPSAWRCRACSFSRCLSPLPAPIA